MSYKTVLEMARNMRRNPTLAERYFWNRVKNKRWYGLKFYRQYIIQHSNILGIRSYFIADFYCHKNKSVIELDGDVHKFRIEHDLLREETLKEIGYNVIRFPNEDILNNWEIVSVRLQKALI